MEKWLKLIETECGSPAREKECNEWYDVTHIADILEIMELLGKGTILVDERVAARIFNQLEG